MKLNQELQIDWKQADDSYPGYKQAESDGC
jgi:hypothetical protein